MKQPTSEQVAALWAFAADRFGLTIADKRDADEMAVAALFLDRLGIMDRETFLERYTTTIGSTVYVPFEPGDPSRDLWSQVELLAHETEHAEQFARDGFDVCAFRYLSNEADRAQYEAEAFRAESEVAYWHFGSTPDADALAAKLSAYNVAEEHRRHVAEFLRASAEITTRGGVVSEVSATVIEWLDEHAPELRFAP